MSYIITYTCEWCGKQHQGSNHEIGCMSGSDYDLRLSDLCDNCYKKVVRALRNRDDIVTNKVITCNMWIGSVLGAMVLGAFIAYVIMNARV